MMSCTKQIIAYDLNEYVALIEQYSDAEIVVIDTVCINAEQRAIIDAQQDNYTYHDFLGFWSYQHGTDEIPPLLNEFNIASKEVLVSCNHFSDRFEDHCYEEKMNELIEEKFGNCFLDSIKLEAEKIYVLKHPNKVFKYYDCDNDKRSIQLEKLIADYKAAFKYPKEYHFKDGMEFSYTTAKFIIQKNGRISDLFVTTEFANEANNKYKKVFTERLKKFVLNKKWEAATSYGYPVHSEMNVTMFYK